MEMMKDAIAWVEIPVSNFDRAKKFYSALYDFEMPEMEMGPNKMGILLYDQEKGGIGGAIVQGQGYTPAKIGVKVYVSGGKDLNTVLNRVEKAGGKVLMKKTQITPELGHFAAFTDCEGNEISLHSME
jgi:predicted enzyme related to lactoylglutathione lyase